jgi:hypothetical protein
MADPRFHEIAASAAIPIEAAGAFWMLHPEQWEASKAAGYGHPDAGYFAGRGGVLGEVPAEIVEAAFGLFTGELVAVMWEMGRAVHGARGGAELYVEQAAEWVRPRLAGVGGLERFAELGERVIAAAPGLGLPLFVGWRLLPRATDPAGHAFQVLLILRELRGSIHMAAVAVAGLTPVEAHLLAGQSAEYMAMFGWAEPYPSVEHLKGVRDDVEEATNTRCAQILAAALTVDEAEELGRIATDIHQAVIA